MIELRVEDEAGSPVRSQSFESNEISIGRAPTNDLVLANAAVSSRHARLFRSDGSWMLEDSKSTNGTVLNGAAIAQATPVRHGDRFEIGGFRLELVVPGEAAATAEGDATLIGARPAESATPVTAATAAEPGGDPVREIKGRLHKRLLEFLDLRWVDLSKLKDAEIRAQTRAAVENILREFAWEIPPGLSRESLVKEIIDEALGLGPLEDLLADDEVTEIMVNRFDQIYIEQRGKLVLSEKKFTSNQAVLAAIERIVSAIGRRIDESSPMVDARLKDGSRVNAIIPPLALKGPSITIRKFNKVPLQIDDLVRFAALTRGMANFLKLAVELRQNTVVSGGTGSGKTTLLNVLSNFIPNNERVITVEDSAELKLQQDHVVSLETRPPNLEGVGAITIRDLVRNSLRMRPDRIIVGECRSGEALDMLQAMNTGHDGSMTTLHANSPRDAVARLETLVLMAGMDLPVRAIRDQISSAVHIILQQTRFSDGTRKVTSISEVTGIDNDQVQIQDIFFFKQDGFDAKGKVVGRHVPTGYIPRFYERLRQRGIQPDLTIFQSEEA